MNVFGKRLKQLRVKKNLLQKDVAKLINITPRNYFRYENGEVDLPMSKLLALAKYFDVSLDYLVGFSNVENSLKVPKIARTAKIFEGAIVTGDVNLKDNTSIWYNTVIRGDLAQITVGSNSNVQECACLHVDKDMPLTIGEYVTIGHNAILHSCTVEGNTIIGMGAIVLNGAKIGKNCIIGAGALVTQNTVIPDGSIVVGNPAQVKREVTEEEIKHIKANALEYVELSKGK